MLILAILGFGMLVGWLAEVLVGGASRPSAESLVVGLIGSFVGGLIVSLLSGDGLALRPSGLIGSIGGAVLVLLVWHAVRPKPATGRRSSR